MNQVLEHFTRKQKYQSKKRYRNSQMKVRMQFGFDNVMKYDFKILSLENEGFKKKSQFLLKQFILTAH